MATQIFMSFALALVFPSDLLVIKRAFAPHPPGVLHECDRKGVAEKGICKTMKTKDEKNEEER